MENGATPHGRQSSSVCRLRPRTAETLPTGGHRSAETYSPKCTGRNGGTLADRREGPPARAGLSADPPERGWARPELTTPGPPTSRRSSVGARTMSGRHRNCGAAATRLSDRGADPHSRRCGLPDPAAVESTATGRAPTGRGQVAVPIPAPTRLGGRSVERRRRGDPVTRSTPWGRWPASDGVPEPPPVPCGGPDGRRTGWKVAGHGTRS